MKQTTNALLIGATALTAIASSAYAEGELNLYSSRHYDTDERLYSAFPSIRLIVMPVMSVKSE
ncbi:MAG: Fe(3+) ABC transporter substrate-binding protein, partial [Pseudomonadota bacterium]